MKRIEKGGAAPKLIAFDMDGTLLVDRVIHVLAKRFGFASELEKISLSDGPKYVRSRNIAKLLRGLRLREFTEVVEGMRLMEGAVEAMDTLRDRGYTIGIISDSYTFATAIVARKLQIDFNVANILAVNDGVISGELDMPLGWEEIGCTCGQSVCKRYQLAKAAERYGVEMRDTVAVGDSEADSCMIESAGVGILFNAHLEGETLKAGHRVKGKDLRLVAAFLERIVR